MSFMDREKERNGKVLEERRFGFLWRVNGGDSRLEQPEETVYEQDQRQRASGQILSARGWVEMQQRGVRGRPRFCIT